MKNEEHALIYRVTKGNEEAFEELFNLFYTNLCRHAQSIVRQKDVAEDIVQEVFYGLWQKRASLNIEHTLSAYLHRTVYYQCMKYLRRKSLEKNANTDNKYRLLEGEILYKQSEQPFSEIQQKDLKNEINKGIENLPEKTKEIFILSRKYSFKNKEIAERLDIDIKTVEYHMAKALVALRKRLKNL
jgi:RNA polymerase sigma-70 factor, ECF subfamily